MVQTYRVLRALCVWRRLDIADTWMEVTVRQVGNILRVL